MKKNLVILVGIVIVLSIAFLSIWNLNSDYSKIIQANWDFEMPNEAKYSQSYTKDSGSSFNGDGIRYHIFNYISTYPVFSIIYCPSSLKIHSINFSTLGLSLSSNVIA